MEFRLLIDMEVLHVLDAMPKGKRTRVLTRFEILRIAPHQLSDYSEQDRLGRRLESHVFEGYRIQYWIDWADRHIKVLALNFADV